MWHPWVKSVSKEIDVRPLNHFVDLCSSIGPDTVTWNIFADSGYDNI